MAAAETKQTLHSDFTWTVHGNHVTIEKIMWNSMSRRLQAVTESWERVVAEFGNIHDQADDIIFGRIGSILRKKSPA